METDSFLKNHSMPMIPLSQEHILNFRTLSRCRSRARPVPLMLKEEEVEALLRFSAALKTVVALALR